MFANIRVNYRAIMMEHLANIEDDSVCVAAAERVESIAHLNDNQDDYIVNVPEDLFLQVNSANIAVPVHSAQDRIRSVLSRSVFGRTYLSEYFFTFDQWPEYMFDLFTSTNIQDYSYVNRNKICVFFWGNGGTFEIMSDLSHFFSPPPRATTAADRRQNESSRRKCMQLFSTYNDQRFNPNYARRYYFYSMIQRRMLFIDGQPRHYGQRQENGLLNRFPAWY